MNSSANFLAIDLGASSGRAMLGRWDGARFDLQELHRFANEPVSALGRLHWDVLRLWHEIKHGMARYATQFDAPLAGIGVDTWGVDFALLDRAGRLLGNPVTYRDPRTEGMIERVFAQVPRAEVFAQTGNQILSINTLFQLASMAGDPQLDAAETLLMMPDLFNYWLTGVRAVEYTNATTTQMFDPRERRWAGALLDRLGLPGRILGPIIEPGTRLGELRAELLAETGLRGPGTVSAPGSHDTASAVAAVPGLDERSAYISSGTWSLVGVEIPAPILSDAALALNVTNEGGVGGTVRLLKNVTGLWLLQESQRQWAREGAAQSWEQLLALAEQAEPFRSLVDPDSDLFLQPGDMPARIREFCRRSGQPAPESIGAVVRACLESLALKYRWVLEAIERVAAVRVETIR
ncbi:MAG TPA: rhamnulokinase family protein, partial [Roseiflexaceae bacterium]|nr:rhamnulokinase family protein [Roseiflexaceae bacterium]